VPKSKPFAPDGQRDLSLIRASGSTARVLNLALVFERFGATEEFAAMPLFKNQRINRALILKHALREHERSLFERPEPHTTKIVFPYSPSELGLGGTSVMIGEKHFDQLFRKAVGANVSDGDYQSDLELLHILHELPSFDPFLMRERLRTAGRSPAKCFFDVSEADVTRMLDFIAGEIEPLTSLAFGAVGRRARILSVRLSEKLMTDEGAQLLDPLRETLRLSRQEYREGVFAWKGYLYYKWLLRDLDARQAEFRTAFKGCVVACEDRTTRMEVERLRRDVLHRTDLVLLGAGGAMFEYANAFGSLTRGASGTFRDFLLRAPAKFMSLGGAMGAVEHVHSFWGFRFPPKAALKLEASEALDIMQELDRMLSGLELVSAAASQELVLN
jgi:hypothetical protein